MPAEEATLARAEALIDLGREREAEQALRSVLAQDPDSERALRLLAQALLDQDRSAEAVATAKLAVAANAESEHAHRLLSHAELEAGHVSRAVLAAQEAVRLAPSMWQTHYTLGMALRRTGTRGLDALACAREACRLAPHEAAPHNLVGLCLSGLGHREQAVKEYEEAVRLDPGDAMALNNLAAMKINNGRLAAAGAMLRSGLSAAPHQQILRDNYDALLLNLVRRLYFALLGLGLVLFLMAQGSATYPVRAGTAVVLLAIYAGATYLVVRTLPRGAHLWARGLFGRISGSRRISVVTFAVLTIGVLVLGLAPPRLAPVVGDILLRSVQALAVGGLIFRAVVSRRRRQDRRPPNGTW